MSEELQIVQNQVLSVTEIKSHVATIHQVMKEVMKKGVHYDKIQGCGDKPMLLKPGAEKILTTFMLAPQFIVEDLSTEHNIYFRVVTKLYHQLTKTYMGDGIGECNSLEKKYAWRAAVCDEEFDNTDENLRRINYKKGWNGKPNEKIQQVRQDMFTISNTLLKMAKKRSLVDAVMNVTACSDIFEQDLDESHIREALKGEDKPEEVKEFKTSKEDAVLALKSCRTMKEFNDKWAKLAKSNAELTSDKDVAKAFHETKTKLEGKK